GERKCECSEGVGERREGFYKEKGEVVIGGGEGGVVMLVVDRQFANLIGDPPVARNLGSNALVIYVASETYRRYTVLHQLPTSGTWFCIGGSPE
ncbi:hypothetical protein HAX54_030465, partial [Datura stramonium]|nr:hypothetical protein [Datura stramonium]